jgi:hypothetical protein
MIGEYRHEVSQKLTYDLHKKGIGERCYSKFSNELFDDECDYPKFKWMKEGVQDEKMF